MIKLELILQKDYETFLEHAVQEYADDHVRNGNWSADEALEKSRKDFEHHLPNGIHTPNQYIWSIVDESNHKIGVLWVQLKEAKAFIFDFIIDREYRGKGYGKQALTAMDEKLKSMGAESVALHVFGDNMSAQALYKKMGFEVTDMHMRKRY
jgi:ribosomal protein S18 acetylase RimI-like enzyme